MAPAMLIRLISVPPFMYRTTLRTDTVATLAGRHGSVGHMDLGSAGLWPMTGTGGVIVPPPHTGDPIGMDATEHTITHMVGSQPGVLMAGPVPPVIFTIRTDPGTV